MMVYLPTQLLNSHEGDAATAVRDDSPAPSPPPYQTGLAEMMSVRPSPPGLRCVSACSRSSERGAGNRVETVDVLPTTGVVWCGAARAVAPSED